MLTRWALLMLVEYASKPLPLWTAPLHPPESYADMLKDAGDGPTSVIFEFPTGSMEDPEYLYYSTFHWQYLVNGYSGFFPPSYRKIVNAVRDFPDRDVDGRHQAHTAPATSSSTANGCSARATNSWSPRSISGRISSSSRAARGWRTTSTPRSASIAS